jgi:hypothetical protein
MPRFSQVENKYLPIEYFIETLCYLAYRKFCPIALVVRLTTTADSVGLI